VENGTFTRVTLLRDQHHLRRAYPALVTHVGLIGAGSSGITALKALVDLAGLAELADRSPSGSPVTVTCWEAGDRVGGNWVFGNSNGMSSSYRSLHINTSRRRMEYADLPMPESYPDFPHHTHLAAYFADYVEHFDLARHIRFNTLVTKADRHPGGGWTVHTDDGTSTDVDVLVVANGHHWDARWPEPAFPGAQDFPGEQVHAHHFQDNTGWAGKRVVVVGMGNSAMDLAVEASWVASGVWLSARTPQYVIPKYVFGRPLDTLQKGRAARLPWRLRQVATHAILRLSTGRLENYGLRTPRHGVFQAHPTISDSILSRIAHGEVTPVGTIEHFEGSAVVFSDGTRVQDVDVVVYATGYRISFPFLDPAVLSAPDNRIELYQRIWHPDVPDLAVIGLVQPLGAIMPIAEQQSKLVADWLRGAYLLPTHDEMLATIDRDSSAVKARYIGSARHTIQVDFDSYLHQLQQERKRGARPARACGWARLRDCRGAPRPELRG
jgi:dimethylaniline monooxygenase (N-oxide forming)